MLLAATHTITGWPALLIILVILALFVLGIVYVVKLTARGARRVAGGGHHRDP